MFGQTSATPIQEIVIEHHKPNLYIKRDDLIHPQVSGNKFRKLKYNIQDCLVENNRRLLTFGGVFSNHLYAFAAVCQHYNLEGIAIIRGEYDRHNPTLRYLKESGLVMHFISRSDYRKRNEEQFLSKLKLMYPGSVFIPEGGSNPRAMTGLSELVEEIVHQSQLKWDYWICASGTGATAAGLLMHSPNHVQIVAVNVLKGVDVTQELQKFLPKEQAHDLLKRLIVLNDYAFGGYAKWSEGLLDFIHQFYEQTSIELDPVYTAKAMFATIDYFGDQQFDNKNLLFLHTGGLQGILGFNYRNNNKILLPNFHFHQTDKKS